MAKTLTIQLAVEAFDFYDLYAEIIESYGEELEDPGLVSDLYDLIDEYEEEFEFQADADGDFSESFERNLKEAINAIVEDNEDLSFIDDGFPDDDISSVYSDEFEKNSDEFGIEVDEDSPAPGDY